jgi:hypothetical protein
MNIMRKQWRVRSVGRPPALGPLACVLCCPVYVEALRLAGSVPFQRVVPNVQQIHTFRINFETEVTTEPNH